MEYTDEDIFDGALCAWRENRGGGIEGMQSVINVLQNRAVKRSSSISAEATRPWQFSGMTAKGDVNLTEYPQEFDRAFDDALMLMRRLKAGMLNDLTGEATMYYAESMSEPPKWASSYQYTTTIAGQKFFK